MRERKLFFVCDNSHNRNFSVRRIYKKPDDDREADEKPKNSNLENF